MSRNFELLQRAEQERAAAARATALPSRTADRPVVARELSASLPDLDLQAESIDQLNKLVQRLFLVPGAQRNVVFSGVERGIGCTWTAVNCARLLAAQVNGAVCLVDANLRYPSLHHFFGISNHSHGLSDAILGTAPFADYLRQVSKSNLSVVTCGSTSKMKEALMASDAVRSRMTELRAEFDYVLIDAPPLTLHPDAIAFGSLADGLLLVLKANSSRRDSAQQALLDCRMANVRVIGAVLNQRTFPVPRSIYDRL
jgi:polysaccharide biosynthesis transport protein